MMELMMMSSLTLPICRSEEEGLEDYGEGLGDSSDDDDDDGDDSIA